MPRLLRVVILIALLSFAPASAQNASTKGGGQVGPSGQSTTPPGNAGNAPGKSETNKGQSGGQTPPTGQGSGPSPAPAPGKSEKDSDPPKNGTNPGQSGQTPPPGQSGGNSGQSGTPTPGKSEKDSDPPKNGTNPGQSGQTPPPGQSGGNPGQGSAPSAAPTPGKSENDNDPPKNGTTAGPSGGQTPTSGQNGGSLSGGSSATPAPGQPATDNDPPKSGTNPAPSGGQTPASGQSGSSTGLGGAQPPSPPPPNSTTAPAPSNVSSDLIPLLPAAHSQPGEPARPPLKVIVQFTTPSGLNDLKSVPGVDLDHQTSLTLIGGTAVSVSPDQVLTVSKLPGVSFISLDRMVSATVDSAGALSDASMAWQSGWDGTGIGIAVIDSGIYAHDDLQDKDLNSRIVFRQDFTGSWVNDDYGHGTHVAGIIAGNGKSSPRQNGREIYRGVAPNANLIDLRVLDQNGVSTDSLVVAAIQKAIELKSRFNIRVINLSLGRPISEKAALDPLCRAVEEAWKAGIVVVVAAGNLGRSGYGTVLAPGNSPYAITVGAMNAMGTMVRSDDRITSYSSKGPTYLDGVVKPDIVAPGNSIASLMAPDSLLATHYPQNRIFAWPNKMGALPYMSLSGTSMAAPAVSGAAALLLQRQPELTPDQIKARLMKTASKDFPVTSTVTDPDTGISYTSQYDIATIGAGYLDLWAALNNTDLATGTAASPALQYDAASRSFYLANDARTVWGSTASWSSSAVWGTNVFVTGSSATSGTSAIWGTSATWGDSAVWGTSAIWGTSAVWGTTGQFSDSETLVTSSAR